MDKHHHKQPRAAVPLHECETIVEALGRFCAENAQFESSVIVESVQKDISEAPDLNTAALAPLRHALFGFDVALRWGFFIHHAAPFIASETEETISAPFDVAKYFGEVAQVYDSAMDPAVWNFVGGDEDDEDDEDDEEDDA